MKLAPSVACFLVAWDAAEKALGTAPQHIVAPDALWLWWIIAAMWAVCGGRRLGRTITTTRLL